MGDWANLSDDLMLKIAALLSESNLLDFLRLNAVANSWRSVITHIGDRSQLPWLMCSSEDHVATPSFTRLSDGNTHELPLYLLDCNDLDCNDDNRYYSRTCYSRTWIAASWKGYSRTWIAGSWKGLLLVINYTEVRLINPLTSFVMRLPRMPIVDEDCFDFDKRYIVYDDYLPALNSLWIRLHMQPKVILTTCGMAIANFPSINRLAVARSGDEEWSLTESRVDICNDILEYQGNIFTVDKNGVVACFDPVGSGTITPITERAPENEDAYRWYLIESSGELLLIARYTWMPNLRRFSSQRQRKFEVYKLDLEGKRVEVRNLDNKILFLGPNNASCIDTRDHPGWEGNRIYFTACGLGNYKYRERGVNDYGIYNMEDGTVRPLPWYPDTSKTVWPIPVWFTPSL